MPLDGVTGRATEGEKAEESILLDMEGGKASRTGYEATPR